MVQAAVAPAARPRAPEPRLRTRAGLRARRRRPVAANPDTDLHARLAARARAEAPLRRVLAQLAGRFVARRGFEPLGFVRLGDYAVERLGRSARSLQELARMDAAFEALPKLDAAFVGGALSWAQARLVARVATEADEAHWIARARGLPVRALEHAVRAVDVGAGTYLTPETDEEGARWFRARQQARRVAGEALPVGECLEALTAEVGSALPVEGFESEVEPTAMGLAPAAPRHGARVGSGRARVQAALRAEDTQRSRLGLSLPRAANGCATQEGAMTDVAGGPGPAIAPWAAKLPPLLRALVRGLDDADAFELDRRLRRAAALEQRFEARLAPGLLRVAEGRRYRERGFPNLESYVRERLGLSPRKARSLLRLERAARRAPALRRAWRGGRLSWVVAHTLMPVALAPEAPLAAWIAWAGRTTVRRLEEDVERALAIHERDPRGAFPPPPLASRNRPTGAPPTASRAEDTPHAEPESARLFWSLPRPAARFFRAVLCTVRRHLERQTGRLPTPGQAFEAMLDHALESWGHPEAQGKREYRVFARDGWRCAVPGCTSYRNLHDHHVCFRSAGGSNALANRVTLCAGHHLRGVHAGVVRISGRAPERLRFELGVRSGRPPLVAYRSGDVRVE
jgi:hypothetical protein